MKMKGFSLLELLVVIIVSSIIASLGGVLIVGGIKNYIESNKIIPVALNANIALNQVTRELKTASRVTSASLTTVTFNNYLDQSITLTLSGTTLIRQVNSGTAQPLCENVASLAFNYYTNTMSAAATPGEAQFITVTITLTDGSRTYSLLGATLLRRAL